MFQTCVFDHKVQEKYIYILKLFKNSMIQSINFKILFILLKFQNLHNSVNALTKKIQ
jgi:hypothetical protein